MNNDNMIIIYIDIILLVILLFLTIFTCGYCFYRVYTLQRSGQVEILLRPTRVLFSHKKDDSNEELRTVVAYQNPFTGDYCVHKNHAGSVYENALPALPPASPDSGLSDEYEPLHLGPPAPPPLPRASSGDIAVGIHQKEAGMKTPMVPKRNVDNSVNKEWSWNYTEYQI